MKKIFFLGTYHLIGEHEHRLERELSLAVVEQVLKRRPQQINDHHVVVSFNAEPVDVWDPNCNQDKTLDNQISQNSQKFQKKVAICGLLKKGAELTYLHPARSGTAWSRKATVGAWFARAPERENKVSICGWDRKR